MKVTITSIKLKRPFEFFVLSAQALEAFKLLEKGEVIRY